MNLRRKLGCVCLLAATAWVGCQSPRTPILDDLPNPPAEAPDADADVGTAPAPATAPAEPAPAVPADWVPPVPENPWRYIVLHHSSTPGGSAEAFDQLRRSAPRNWDELGYHFVIGNGDGAPDGAVQVGPRWRKQKWGAHTGGTDFNEYNNFGVGICLVGDFNETQPTEAQLAALQRLLAFLRRRYDIAPSAVLGHREAPNATTDCPGDALQRWIEQQLRGRDE